MNMAFIKKIIMAFIASVFLVYILIITKDLLTRIVVIPFLMFGISLFMKNLCLIFEKHKIAKIFSKINVVSFFIYYFGFLVYWDYVAITNKDSMLLVFSLLAWAGGIFVLCKRYLRLKNIDRKEK